METKNKIQIGVMFGGRSSEHEVSLMSARSVLGALSPDKYDIIPIGITHEGVWVTGKNTLEAMEARNITNLKKVTLIPGPFGGILYSLEKTNGETVLEPIAKLDVIFPVLHGTFGEDGTIQGLLEIARIPYVGAGVLASSVCMDKALFKEVMRANNLPVLPSVLVTTAMIQQGMDSVLDRLEAFSPYPLFVKPSNGGSSVGITKCRSRGDLLEGLMEAARYDRRVLVEKALSGREIEVSVLGNRNPQASLPGEIIPAADFYNYNAKYFDEKTELLVPAPLPGEVIERLKDLAIRAYKATDCSGMGRVDFLIDKQSGEIVISEINTIPGFTKISMYPKLWEVSGLPYSVLVDRLVELALERKSEIDRLEFFYRRNG